MRYFHALIRLVALTVWLLVGVGVALFAVNVRKHEAYSPRHQRIIRWWARGLLTILAVHVRQRGAAATGSVWVANHISWLDIVVLMSVMPCRFLSKAEVASWPLIGWLAQRSGTVFLRRGQGETAEAMALLRQLVQQGDAILFFPEGTTTDGVPKLFHARLFALPIDLQKPVQPIALTYLTAAHKKADIAYVGTQSFIQNLWQLLKQQRVIAQVSFMSLISVEGCNRNTLAQIARTAICANLEAEV
ncbi:MAG: 1-acyl-sn-glycerol-3-phosphate acyltransferase [Thiotrichales bacterium]|jgi:1-acyl-sn-glycerol-3-phosphate acyltransferase|nr:1-acyl-sn-glycerol-3-phosphate acyltransferase [Thiotrichales bacterium]